MKALTIMQPWASLIAVGEKHMETRSWSTAYRGPIAIHASKRITADVRLVLTSDPFPETMERHGLTPSTIPLGAVVATATLVDCVRTEDDSSLRRWIRHFETSEDWEFEFGNFSSRRFAWVLDDVEVMTVPVPAKGSLGIWEWEEAVAR